MYTKLISLLLVPCILCVPANSRNVDILLHRNSCINDSSQLQCTTLSQCLSGVSSCIMENTSLNFQPGIHTTNGLSGLVKIQNVVSVQFQGQNSTIKCHGQVGFMFYRVDKLQIHGLSFCNCGTIFEVDFEDLLPSQNPFTFRGTKVAVLIANSYNVDVIEVSITNSSGYGLFVVNLLGNSSISKTTISHSNYAAIDHYRHNFDLCQNPENHDCSGGNVLLLYEECSLCSYGPHQLEVSSMVAEFGTNLQNWDANRNTEPAGGLTISTRQSDQYFVTIVVRHSTIASNTGKYAGNAALLLYSASFHITFLNTSFLNGNAEVKYYADYSNSGGMYNYWEQLGALNKSFVIDNCTFANNSGLIGGAMFISSITDNEILSLLTLVLHIKNSDIRENFGHSGIIRLQSKQTGESSVPTNYLSITLNNTRIYKNRLLHPSNNQALSSIRYEVFSNSAIYGNCLQELNLVNTTIAGNAMRGIDIDSTRQFFFSGTNYIISNVAENGGGMKLFRSTFLMRPASYLYITKNQASSYGGGIFIREDDSNTCFFQLCNITIMSQPRIIVRENSANLSGNSIFGGNIDLCQLEGVFFTNGFNTFNEIFDIPYNNSLTEVTSYVRQLCFCREHRPDCSIRSKIISIFPGQGFSVSAAAIGQLNGTIVDTAVSYIMNNSADVTIGLQQDAQKLLTVCTQLNYTLSSRENEITFIGLQTNYDKNHRPNGILLSVEVHTTACPVGFSLDQLVCDCNEFLRSFAVECFIDQQYNIHRPFPIWVGYKGDKNLLLAHRSCPRQYCKSEAVNLTLDETDLQCQSGHSGILCGSCKENLSVTFGTYACKKCSNNYLLLLLLFVIAGLLLVATMMYGDLTLSRGTFNGLIFYANIVRVNQSIFFPPNHINVITVFIAWLNLDFGIEVCFYDGMDAYARTWVQYLFPAYIWILIVLVIFAGWYSNHAAKIFGGNAVQVLATLLLLSYTKIQRIVLETWSSTFVTHENGSFSVWLADGNIPFMKGKHIFLSLMSIAVVVGFIVPFTLLLLCEYPLQSKFGPLMVRYKMTPFIDAYQGSYKMRFRWWSGVMLLIRGALLVIFGLNILGDPRLNLVLIVSMCAVLLGIMWNTGAIYKERHVNMIESFFLLNLGLLSAWTLYNSTNFLLFQIIVSYTFVTLSLLVFMAIVGGQIFFRLRKKCGKRKNDLEVTERETVAKKTGIGNESLRESLLNSY